MSFGKKGGIFLQLALDWLAAIISWSSFFVFRKLWVENTTVTPELLIHDINFILGISLVPIGWVILYFVSGTYTDIYRKSRLAEIGKTLLQTLVGVLLLFFLLLLDDIILSYKTYYASVGFLVTVHFILTVLLRITLLTIGKINMRNGKYSFTTAIIGGKQKSLDFYLDNHTTQAFSGQQFIGFINVNGSYAADLTKYIPLLGKIDDVEAILEEKKIQEVIIAIDSSEHSEISKIVNALTGYDIVIKIIPDMYDILSGKVKMNQLIEAPIIEIYPETMSKWQLIFKRAIDIVVSFLSILFLFPFLVFIAISVKLSSPGPIFYSQERVGYKGKPFKILKFRSMQVDAEIDGPALSSNNDNRITSWGKVMRKWRLDELPQFWNVLVGEMSLIGPRPERKFYINKMAESAPHCKHLQRVRPGITSLGMVRYGYAENVDQMIERLKYDIIYIENRSLVLDFKIVLYTINTLLKGRGK